MKFQIGLLAFATLGFFYSFYLKSIDSRGSCENGNLFACADQIQQLESSLAQLTHQANGSLKFCENLKLGFCAEAVETDLQRREKLLAMQKVQAAIKCSIATPFSLLRMACQEGAFESQIKAITLGIAKNLKSACQPNPGLDTSCEPAIAFAEKHPEFQAEQETLLERGCERKVLLACERVFAKHSADDSPEAAEEDFKNLFALRHPGILSALPRDCTVDERFWPMAQKEIEDFDIELKKDPRDLEKLKASAQNAVVLNCRSRESRLRLAISESLANHLQESRQVLEKLDDGQKEFIENPSLEALRGPCVAQRQLHDPWCLGLFKVKMGYLEPEEVKAQLQPKMSQIKAQILKGQMNSLVKAIHPTAHLKYVIESGQGEKKVASVFLPLTKPATKEFAKLQKLMTSAKDYLQAGDIEYRDLATRSNEKRLEVHFKIYDGHRADNYRSLRLEFGKWKSNWSLTEISFLKEDSP